jgi:spermidine/putrescine transport system substrate-binding protein
MPENAIKNMEEIGYVSVISSPEILEWAQDTTFAPSDISYFFGENADSVCVNPIMYPDSEIIAKCALMHDAGDMTQELINMWNRVKGDNLNMGLVCFLVIIVLTGVVFGIYALINKRRNLEKQTTKKHKRKK